ncbi:MAG TPA: hypothetical protein VKD69_23390 [Vicinamibacterales bacterium]|nr:hypothetical protein [Vicinamibacterales bacterium]
MAIDYSRRHLRFGWWTLLVFATLGLILESLQGFKVAAYLDAANETRRTMWRLAHAHGTLLGVINILFGLTVRSSASPPAATPRISTALVAATLLLPSGFFLGGIIFYAGDPGLGVLLVPVGGVLLLLALLSIARGTNKREETR